LILAAVEGKKPSLLTCRFGARGRGQAMAEFALVAPVLLFMIMATLEVGLLTFSISTARFAAEAAGRLGSQLGNYYQSPTVNADQSMVTSIRQSALGTTTLTSIDGIDIEWYDYTATPSPSFGPHQPGCPCVNSYNLDGSMQGGIGWPIATRNVSTSSDFMRITIRYRYKWKSGSFLSPQPLVLSTAYIIRLEAQQW
jgi:Flp pilus assembly protein TadG